jgi:AraC family transcriptional activator of pobA
MPKPEKLEEFYLRKFDWIPASIGKEIGHFNVFKLDPFIGKHASPVPYKKRDFFKITLIKGKGTVHFADQVIHVKKQAITFSNPMIPYKWEHTDKIKTGFFCIFDKVFINNFINIKNYAVYQPHGSRVFELNDEQYKAAASVFGKMFEEIESDYLHKYDVIRGLVLELIHMAMKIKPSETAESPFMNAAQRISMLFLELLERQFPIDESHREIQFKTPAAFAKQLGIHVNHLNKSVKEITDKTSTEHIAERLLQESKIMLRHGNMSVSEIAYALGFNESSHFNNFFKKQTGTSPLAFRKSNS